MEEEPKLTFYQKNKESIRKYQKAHQAEINKYCRDKRALAKEEKKKEMIKKYIIENIDSLIK
jgi:hypothetical protein